MKKLIKTVAATALAVVLICAFAACSFGAKTYVATEDSYFSFEYLAESDSYSVAAASVANLPEEVYLPKEHDGKPVSAVKESGFSGAGIKKVYLPLNIKTVGKSAFADCVNLTEAYYYKGNGVKEIADGAFLRCTALGELVCPSSLVKIGDSAFWGCTAIERIKLPEKVEVIGKSAFAYCTSLTYFYVPTRLYSLGDGAFTGCDKITFEKSESNVHFVVIEGKLHEVEY